MLNIYHTEPLRYHMFAELTDEEKEYIVETFKRIW
jgi:hypothetical protein